MIRIFALVAFFALIATADSTNKADLDTRKVIVVVDTGITHDITFRPYMCRRVPGALSADSDPATYPTGMILDNYSMHGSNVVGLIGERIDAKKYCIVSILAFRKSRASNMHTYLHGLAIAKKIPGVVAVNLSIDSGAPGINSYSAPEHQLVEELTSRGIQVFVAAGNSGMYLTKNLCNAYPACLKFLIKNQNMLHIVGSADVPCKTRYCDAEKHATSNWSKNMELDMIFQNGTNTGYPPMSGTSQATAKATGEEFSK